MRKNYRYSLTDGWIDKPDALTAIAINAILLECPFMRGSSLPFSSNVGEIKFDLPLALTRESLNG